MATGSRASPPGYKISVRRMHLILLARVMTYGSSPGAGFEYAAPLITRRQREILYPTRRWCNAVLFLGQRRRRWASNEKTLDQSLAPPPHIHPKEVTFWFNCVIWSCWIRLPALSDVSCAAFTSKCSKAWNVLSRLFFNNYSKCKQL